LASQFSLSSFTPPRQAPPKKAIFQYFAGKKAKNSEAWRRIHVTKSRFF
jgi:hypothetical protein